MKRALTFLFLAFLGQNTFAASCSFYIEDLALLKTLDGLEVGHHRYEKLQLLEGNMYRKGYKATTNRENATITIENYDVVMYRNGQCGSGELLINNNVKNVQEAFYSSGCSKLGLIMNYHELNLYKDLIRQVPTCNEIYTKR